MTQSICTEQFILVQIFLDFAGIWINHPLGSILGQEGRLSLPD